MNLHSHQCHKIYSFFPFWGVLEWGVELELENLDVLETVVSIAQCREGVCVCVCEGVCV